MSVASEISAVFGWRKGEPNIADHASNTSAAIAAHIFSSLNITRESTESGQTLGNKFEDAAAGFLKRRLADLAPDRSWIIDRRPITDFANTLIWRISKSWPRRTRPYSLRWVRIA